MKLLLYAPFIAGGLLAVYETYRKIPEVTDWIKENWL
jgi:hypothetical protein